MARPDRGDPRVGVLELFKMILAHQERVALIERGIHPDSVKKNEPT
jgi:hypothetical protein